LDVCIAVKEYYLHTTRWSLFDIFFY